MTKNSKQREVLLSGADGFSLNETARLLGDEWGEEARHVARSLLRSLKKGEFDPPPGWESFDWARLFDPAIPQSEKLDYDYYPRLMSDDRLAGEVMHSGSGPVLFSEEMQVGNEGDFGDQIFLPVKAIARFCAVRDLPVPAFMAPAKQDTSDAVLREEEVYRVLVEVQSKDPVQIPMLAKTVGKRLGRTVTPQMVCFKNALKRARVEGIVTIAHMGRPPKS